MQRDDVNIYYEDHGAGFPLLALAPGGMRSTVAYWANVPWSPVSALSGAYRVIAMDQRNAGSSSAPVTGSENWDSYAADQLALLDHLGIEHCHVVGMCIGGAFILNLLRTAPERFIRAVALQPIGLDNNRAAFHELFDGWRDELAPNHPEATPAAWAAYRAALYDSDNVLFSVPESVLPTITTPMLVLRGNDQYHPASASELLASSVPGARLIERWKEPEHLPAADAAIRQFLAAG